MRRLLLSLGLMGSTLVSTAQAQRTHVVVVTGLGGEPAYSDAFAKQGAALVDVARGSWRVADSSLVWLAEDPSRHLATAFEQSTQQAVVVSGIEFHSTCEHHFLPFFGKAHVAYMPSGDRVVGLSKLARTVDVFARRPQLQERLTEQICDALEEHLSPRGVCVVLEAEHLCMRLRGAKKPGAVTRTLGLRGHYRRDVDARREVMSLMDIRQA